MTTIQGTFGTENRGPMPGYGIRAKKIPISGVNYCKVWSKTPKRMARGGGQGLSMAAPDGLFVEVSGLFRVFSTRGLARFARPFSRGFFRDLGVIVSEFQSFIETNYSKSCQKPPCAREAILHG